MSRLHTEEAQQLAELAALVADGPRMARGRGLYRRGRVSGVFVSHGEVIASVEGSEPEPYEVVLATRDAPNHAQGVDLVPGAIDVSVSCTCPDWSDMCKHGAAALLGFADEVDDDLSLLARWRGKEAADASESTIPSAASDMSKAGQLDRAMKGLPVTRGMPNDEPEADPLAEFFTGDMPASGVLLDADALRALADKPNPFLKARLLVETLDAAPHLGEALEVVIQATSAARE